MNIVAKVQDAGRPTGTGRRPPRWVVRFLPVLGLLVGGGFLAVGSVSAHVQSFASSSSVGGSFVPVTPYRIADTRPNSGYQAAGRTLGAGQTLNVQVTGTASGDIPTGAAAAVLNVTAVDPTASGLLTVFLAGTTMPLVSNLNFVAGAIVPNLVTVPLSSTGGISIYNHAGSTNVIVDAEGYYLSTAAAKNSGLYNSLSPTRVLGNLQTGAAIGAGATTTVPVAGAGATDGVPAGASAVVVNVTAAHGTAPSFLTVFSAGVVQPTASNLNFGAGQTIANRVTVGVGSSGQIAVYNHTGTVNVDVDVDGYYTGSSGGTGALFVPITPVRLTDTRVLMNGTPIGSDSSETFGLSAASIPSNASSVAANLTVLAGNAPGYLTAYPTADTTVPVASDVNWMANGIVPNFTIADTAGSGRVAVFNSPGATSNLLIDAFGYFTPLSTNPTLTAVSPSAGPTLGGTSVAITGTNFTGATAVDFATAAATSFTVASSTSITATSPAGSPGTVNVTVTTPHGTSVTSSVDQYTYIALAATLSVSAPSTAIAGTAFSLTVTAKDSYGNTATGYTGTVHFTSTDGAAVLPGNYTFTAADAGVHTFTSGATLKTAGSQTITVTDTGTASITGTTPAITVSPNVVATLTQSTPTTPETAGTTYSVTLTATDAYGNATGSGSQTVTLAYGTNNSVLTTSSNGTKAAIGAGSGSLVAYAAGADTIALTFSSSGIATLYYMPVTATTAGTLRAAIGTVVATEATGVTVNADPISSAVAVLDPSSGGPGYGYHTTAGYWLNGELGYGVAASGAHALQVTLTDQYGNLITGSQTLTAASGFEVAASGGAFGATAPVTFSSGVGVVYVENASGYTSDLATSAIGNGTIASGTTIATTSNSVAITTPSAVTTLKNFAAGTLVSSATVSAASGAALGFSGGLAPNTTASDISYYNFQIGEYEPGTSGTVDVQIAVPNGGTAVYSMTVNGTTIVLKNTSGVAITQGSTTATASFVSSNSTFTATKGYIYSIGEAAADTTASATAPTQPVASTNDGYVRAGA